MSGVAGWKPLAAAVVLSFAVIGCGNTVGEGGAPQAQGGKGGGAEAAQSINAAGASFPAPFYTAAFQEFAEESGIQVNYQSIGSSGGREQFIQKAVAFGASDAPMDEEEEQQAGGGPRHIATVGGAVCAAYNLEDAADMLNLTGDVLADIYLGNITTWDDPAIAELNPDVQLPSDEIAVVHRSDGSGTTEIFTSYLAAVNPAWEGGPGAGSEIRWPTGIGADGNEGVAGQVQQTPNSIGYVAYEYAAENDLNCAAIGEGSGNFVESSVETAEAAIAAADIPEDLKVVVSSTNPQGENVYPITGFTWLLVRTQMEDLAECKAVAEAAWYLTHDAQSRAAELNYVPVPDNVVSRDEEFIRSMQAEGQPCYGGGGETT